MLRYGRNIKDGHTKYHGFPLFPKTHTDNRKRYINSAMAPGKRENLTHFRWELKLEETSRTSLRES